MSCNTQHDFAQLVSGVFAPGLKQLYAAVMLMMLLTPSFAVAAQQDTLQEEAVTEAEEEPSGKVIGLKYNCVHVLKLEKTLKLYREILGFRLAGADVLHGPGIEGMLVMKLTAGNNGCNVFLSLPSPMHQDTVGPIGNTNHNHFMLLVDNIVPICDKLKEAGYELENENYSRDKYSFFTGPNGEIVGLTEYPFQPK